MLKPEVGKCARSWPKPRGYKKHSVYWVGERGICVNCGKGFVKRRR